MFQIFTSCRIDQFFNFPNFLVFLVPQGAGFHPSINGVSQLVWCFLFYFVDLHSVIGPCGSNRYFLINLVSRRIPILFFSFLFLISALRSLRCCTFHLRNLTECLCLCTTCRSNLSFSGYPMYGLYPHTYFPVTRVFYIRFKNIPFFSRVSQTDFCRGLTTASTQYLRVKRLICLLNFLHTIRALSKVSPSCLFKSGYEANFHILLLISTQLYFHYNLFLCWLYHRKFSGTFLQMSLTGLSEIYIRSHRS